MALWKTAALSTALAGAVGIGGAFAPAAHGQSARATTPHAVEIYGFGAGRIGVSVSDVTPESGKGSAGVLVESVDEESPAGKAGFRKGDLIVEFDGERVRSVRQFTRLVSETPIGRTVTAVVQRDGQRVTMNVAPRQGDGFRWLEEDARRRADEVREFAYTVPRIVRPDSPMRRDLETLIRPGGAVLGVTTDDMSSQLAEYFGTKEGALVSSVRADSLGAKIGLKAGDVITAVNGATVTSSADLRRRLARLESGEEFTLGIVRDKKSMTLKGKIEPRTPPRSVTRTIL